MPDGWRVVNQRATEDLVSGRWTDLMVVSVVTDDGTTKDFRIPDANYTPDKVAAIVGEWFERQQMVSGL